MQKADILRFLLLAFAFLAIHYGILWRQWNLERLQVNLLTLEWDLALLKRRLPGSAELRQLESLIGRLRELGPDLVFARIIAAKLLPGNRAGSNSCRQALQKIEDQSIREQALSVLNQAEKSVALKLTTGSPLLWCYLAFRFLSGATILSARGLAESVPGFDLLESTLIEDVL